MKTIIAIAAASLVFAFTAHADEIARAPLASRQLAKACSSDSHWLQRVAYIPQRTARCAQFLATGNVLQTHHWSHT